MKASESADPFLAQQIRMAARYIIANLNAGSKLSEDIIIHIISERITPAITQAEARGREQMADAVRKAMQDGYPEPPTKGDECEHGKFGWEDCIACYDTALEAAITALIPGEPA